MILKQLSEPHWVILRLIFDNADRQSETWYRSLDYLREIYGKDVIARATAELLAERYGAEYS